MRSWQEPGWEYDPVDEGISTIIASWLLGDAAADEQVVMAALAPLSRQIAKDISIEGPVVVEDGKIVPVVRTATGWTRDR